MSDTALRRCAAIAVAIVAAIAATVSYLHVFRLAVQLGQPDLAAWLMPLSVDGSVGAASAALLSAARLGHSSPWAARVMLALGVLATLTANAYSGSAHGAAGMALACWPAVAFVGSTEAALGMVRRAAKPDATPASVPDTEIGSAATVPTTEAATADDTPAAEPVAKRSSGRTRKSGTQARVAAIVRRQPDISGAQLGRKLGVSERTGRRYLSEAGAAA